MIRRFRSACSAARRAADCRTCQLPAPGRHPTIPRGEIADDFGAGVQAPDFARAGLVALHRHHGPPFQIHRQHFRLPIAVEVAGRRLIEIARADQMGCHARPGRGQLKRSIDRAEKLHFSRQVRRANRDDFDSARGTEGTGR